MKQISFRSIFVLILASSLVALGANHLPESIFYKKLFSAHLGEINGIAAGDSKSDVVFKMGPPVSCSSAKRSNLLSSPVTDPGIPRELLLPVLGYTEPTAMRCAWGTDNLHITFSSGGKVESIYVNVSMLSESLPTNTEMLTDIFGEPEIYAVSTDLLSRLYTYSDDNLQTGITYHYEGNRLAGLGLGAIKWRGIFNETYVVDGAQYCPGTTCPWTQNSLKSEWKKKTVRHLHQAHKN